MVGISGSRNVGFAHTVQVEGTDGTTSSMSLIRNSNDNNGPHIDFAKSRGTSTGSNTVVQDGDTLGNLVFRGVDGTDANTVACQIQGQVDGTPGSNDMPGRLVFKTTADGASSATERMRIDSSGNVGIGLTSLSYKLDVSSAFDVARFHHTGTGDTIGMVFRHGRGLSGFTGKMVSMQRNDGTEVGSITIGVSSTGFNTSSDYRLKENVADLDGAVNRVKQLAPKRFNFIDDPDKTVDGFLAHEAQTVVPEAVTGTHNQVDDDGNAVMQGIDHSKLVPLLTAALKEAIAKIETLEAKVTALEAE